MNLILFLFIFPIATIIFSIAFQKILGNPLLVSAIVFAIFLIVTFLVYGINFIYIAIIYAILALITACIVSLLSRLGDSTIQINIINNNDNNECRCRCRCNNDEDECNDDPDTEACRICACQRQFRRCLRGR